MQKVIEIVEQAGKAVMEVYNSDVREWRAATAAAFGVRRRRLHA